MKLERYRSDMENLKDLAEVNAALESIARVNNEFDIGSARSSFEAARNAVEGRHLRSRSLAELSENPTEKLSADLEQLALDEEVSRRLEAITAPPPPALPDRPEP